jgi:hypothetical protein
MLRIYFELRNDRARHYTTRIVADYELPGRRERAQENLRPRTLALALAFTQHHDLWREHARNARAERRCTTLGKKPKPLPVAESAPMERAIAKLPSPHGRGGVGEQAVARRVGEPAQALAMEADGRDPVNLHLEEQEDSRCNAASPFMLSGIHHLRARRPPRRGGRSGNAYILTHME